MKERELDDLWKKLSADPASEQCGWLKDNYGVSWQIVPTVLSEMTQDTDAQKSDRVLKASLQMKQLDIKTLAQAHEQGDSNEVSQKTRR